jgi:hypothetical protein
MLLSTEEELKGEIGCDRFDLSCFWGNLLRYSVHCEHVEDARVQAIAGYLVRDGLETGWRCRHNGELACAWGCARALWGLAALPRSTRTQGVEEAIHKGVNWLLGAHSLVEADYPTAGRIHRLWRRLNFPLFYQADVLFVIRVLVELGMTDHPGAARALQWLADRQMKNGRWRGTNPYRQRTWGGIADGADVNRWATLHALQALNSSR